jgi:hypothetical protein
VPSGLRVGIGTRTSELPMRHFPYPKPRRHLRVPATGIPEDADPRRYWDHSTWVIRWMGRNALRHLRELEKQEIEFPDVEALDDWLREMVDRQAPQHHDYATVSKIQKQTREAAEYALDVYDSDALVYRRAAKGGRNSRRRSPLLARLRALPTMTVAEQAVALECTPRHVKRLRKQLNWSDFEAEMDELFGSREV